MHRLSASETNCSNAVQDARCPSGDGAVNRGRHMSRVSIEIAGFAHTNPVPSACRVGNLVVTGGIAGSDPETGKLPEGIEDQCRNLFHHMRQVMEQAGGSVDDIAKLEVWMKDLGDREVLNREWLAMFPDPVSRPTRQAISGDRGFYPDVKVVGSLIAVIGDAK